MTDARAITVALQGKWHGHYGMVRCVVHDEHTPALKLSDGDTALLVHCFGRHCDARDVRAALRRRVLLGDRCPHRGVMPTAARPKTPTGLRWSERAEATWRSCEAFDSRRMPYFRLRGCADPDCDEVRLSPAMQHWLTGTTWPAIVSRITDFATGEPLSLHFTFLSDHNTSKAPLEKPKLLLRDHVKTGGVIRLTDDADVTTHLGLAEGIESALAVTAALGPSSDWLPVWAAIDAGNMTALPVSPGVERLTIFADTDPAGTGQAAARKLAARWHAAGREVFIARPPAPAGVKRDWADGVAA